MKTDSQAVSLSDPAPPTPPVLSQPNQRDSLDASVRDAMGYATMVGAAETYLSAFGIFLKISTVQIGLLSALPPFLGACAQLLSVRLLDFIPSRRQLIVFGARLQALSLLPIALLPFLFADTRDAAPWLIGLVIIYHMAVGIAAPIWSSLIGDLVPFELRGRFFAFRNQRAGIATLAAVTLAGCTLHLFDGLGATAWGFVLILLVAMLARLRSAFWITRHEDPIYSAPRSSYFSFFQFVRRIRHSNFTRFVFFVSLINGAAAFSAPYFAIYMLRELQFPYIEYTLVTAAATVSGILALQHWGSLVDTFGSKRILSFCSFGVSIVPALWLFSAHPLFLILVQLYSGFVWAGFNLAAATFMFDAVSPPKRARCAAYQAVVNATCVLLGSLLGGYIAEHLPRTLSLVFTEWTPASPFLLIFLASGMMRLSTSLLFLRRFNEVRPIEEPRSLGMVFQSLHFKPFGAPTYSLIDNPFSKRPLRRRLRARLQRLRSELRPPAKDRQP